MRLFSSSVLFFIILLIVVLLVACERPISIELPEGQNDIVVEGYIENDSFPVVMLTRSIPYFQGIDLNQLGNTFIKGAKVRVITGNDTFPLQEFSITIDSNAAPIVAYVQPFLRGEIGKTYRLEVEAEGKFIHATTTILPPVPIDSFQFERIDSTNTIFLPENSDSMVRLLAFFKDPAGQNDYYRYWTRRESMKDSYSPLAPYTLDINSSLFTLSLFDGLYVTGAWIQGSRQRGDSIPKNPEYFKIGDTVSLKWGAVDKAQFQFWETYTNNLQGGGPFSPPVVVRTNVVGGQGIWAGTGVKYYKNIVVR